jgi:hypothetical protein
MSDTKDITVEYLITPEPNQTDSAFYCWQHGWETLVTVTAGEREFAIGVNGEMRIEAPQFDENGEWSHSDTWRYSDDLTSNGIDTDEKLYEFSNKYSEYDIWQNNNWFEFYEVDGEDSWEVCDTLEEAIEAVKAILADDTAGRE